MKISEQDYNSPQAQAIREAAKSLEGKSQQELMEALMSATAQERAQGKLNNEQMDDMYNTIAPMLNHSQRQKLELIMNQLKS